MADHTGIEIIPRKTFFENANTLDPQVSPDGRWLSWIAPAEGVMNVWVAPRDDLGKARALTRQTDRPIFEHQFARTNAHVLFRKDKAGDENFHVWCVGIDGSEARDLTPYPGVMAWIAGLHQDDPNIIAVAMNDRDPRWHDLYIVDIHTGERRLIYENKDEIANPIFDVHLNLRLAVTTRDRKGGAAILKWSDRAGFKEIIEIEADDALSTGPLHVNRAGDAWFLLSGVGRDKTAILRVDWATDAQTLVFADDKADIEGYLVDRRTREVVAVSTEYVRSKWSAIDAAAARDLARLEQELDGDLAIGSQSDDDMLWIVGLSRPDRPFRWYLLDRHTGTLTYLFSARPKLEKLKLAPMHGVIIKSRDGLDLVSYLTLPASESGPRPARPLPMVLRVHGGPWARNGWDYDRDAQWYANRGYAVLQVNYRGSTGFGKAFVNAGDREWAAKMHDDLIDAVDWAVAEGIADAKRIAICGASYGGYASFVGATFTPDMFCCSIPVVGITNLETLLANPPPYWASFYEQECRRIGDPRTEEGRALLRARSPLHRAGDIVKPMLIGHGANDVRCKIAEADQIVAAMTAKGIPVTYVVFPDEGHGFARPENNIAFNAIAEAFLARHLGGRCEPPGDDLKGSSHQIRAGDTVAAG